MSDRGNRAILLARRPTGMPQEDDFELVDLSVRDPAEGEILVRNAWMSVDPYMRGRMRNVKSYVSPYEIGEPIGGGCVGRVVTSRHPGYREGEWVLADHGWREFWVSDGSGVTVIDPALAPPQTYLGVMGMPGLTAYVGLLRVAGVSAGETVLVSAAAGAVGSTACQIAGIDGCRVVACAGSDEKLAWLAERAGVEAVVNHRKERRLAAALAGACPGGVDVFFDNVGGDHLEAGLSVMNDHGRIVACGMISQYNERIPPPGPRNLIVMVIKRLTMRGFIVYDHLDLLELFQREMAAWLHNGQIEPLETIYEGLERAPEAFMGLFAGKNSGKMLVRIGPSET